MKRLISILVFVLVVGAISISPFSIAEPIQPRTSKESKHVNDHSPRYIWIKYRQTQVDIADLRFEYLDTSRSSFVRGAWYDENNSYMIIGLAGTYYHYCRMPR